MEKEERPRSHRNKRRVDTGKRNRKVHGEPRLTEKETRRVDGARTMRTRDRAKPKTNEIDRLEGQDPEEERNQRDLKAELEANEREYLRKQGKLPVWGDVDVQKHLQDGRREKHGATDHEDGPLTVHQLDADGTDHDDSEPDSEGEEDEGSDEEDDTAALVAELERIKKERAEEAATKAAERAAQEEREEMQRSREENPLLDLGGSEASFAIKRRWDDDVVFRNQARHEKKARKRFVNDTVRNDFHRRFLDKYIK